MQEAAERTSSWMTSTGDTTMTEDKQCLQRVQRDTTEDRCLEEGCGKNMLDVWCDLTQCQVDGLSWSHNKAQRNWKLRLLHCVMVQEGYECQPGPTCPTFAAMVGRTEVLFQPSFCLCCLRNMQRSTRCGVGDQTPDTAPHVGEQSTMRITTNRHSTV